MTRTEQKAQPLNEIKDKGVLQNMYSLEKCPFFISDVH